MKKAEIRTEQNRHCLFRAVCEKKKSVLFLSLCFSLLWLRFSPSFCCISVFFPLPFILFYFLSLSYFVSSPVFHLLFFLLRLYLVIVFNVPFVRPFIIVSSSVFFFHLFLFLFSYYIRRFVVIADFICCFIYVCLFIITVFVAATVIQQSDGRAVSALTTLNLLWCRVGDLLFKLKKNK